MYFQREPYYLEAIFGPLIFWKAIVTLLGVCPRVAAANQAEFGFVEPFQIQKRASRYPGMILRPKFCEATMKVGMGGAKAFAHSAWHATWLVVSHPGPLNLLSKMLQMPDNTGCSRSQKAGISSSNPTT